MQRFNDWLAIKVTRLVGNMYCAYFFMLLAFLGLPAALKPGGEGFIPWFAQTFLQLVLLSVIMVGQDIQSRNTEHRDIETHDMVAEEFKIGHMEQDELVTILNDLKELLADIRAGDSLK